MSAARNCSITARRAASAISASVTCGRRRGERGGRRRGSRRPGRRRCWAGWRRRRWTAPATGSGAGSGSASPSGPATGRPRRSGRERAARVLVMRTPGGISPCIRGQSDRMRAAAEGVVATTTQTASQIGVLRPVRPQRSGRRAAPAPGATGRGRPTRISRRPSRTWALGPSSRRDPALDDRLGRGPQVVVGVQAARHALDRDHGLLQQDQLGPQMHVEQGGDLEQLAQQPAHRHLGRRPADHRLADRAQGLGEGLDRMVRRHVAGLEMDPGDAADSRASGSPTGSRPGSAARPGPAAR